MPRSGDVYSLPAGSIVVNGTTIDASQHNTPLNDIAADLNAARPIVAGGTGATTAAGARTALGVTLANLGVTATDAELNILDGATVTTAELNILDGVTATASEINLLDGAVDHATSAWEAGTATEAGLPSPADVSAAIAALSPNWTETAVVATTSGSAFDVTSIPSGVTEIEVVLNAVSQTGASPLAIQIGTGGAPTASGYAASTAVVVAAGFGANTSTTAFLLFANAADYAISAIFSLRKLPGVNTWVASFSGTGKPSTGETIYGGGVVTLAGVLDNLRLASGGSAFDAGSFFVRYR